MVDGILTREERDLALKCMEKALAKGAEKVRVTAYKSVMDLVGTLNGEVDKVKHSLDRFLSVCLFVDARKSGCSTMHSARWPMAPMPPSTD